ncbi:hypothetical protein JHK82_038297 [Glycine max]|nr:hypothetical protein JHK82_038297 [Glycine max]KAG5132306.1 hypothetical protein JHK84_038703 [Glycine max]
MAWSRAATAEDAAAEAYESPKLKKLITDCTGHVGETCSTTTSSSGSEALMQKQDGLALCLLDSMERCLLDHQTNVGTLGDLITLPPFPPRPPVDPNIIPFPRPPNIVPFIKRRRSKLDNHQTDAGTLGKVIPLPPIRPGPPLKIIPFPGTNIVPFPRPPNIVPFPRRRRSKLDNHQTDAGTLGDLIILPPFPPRPPVDPNIIPFPRPPNIVPFSPRGRRSKLDNHQTDAGTLGRVIPLPPIRPGPPLKIIPFPGTNIVPFPKPYIPHSYNTITNLLGARRDQVQDLPLLIQTTQLRTVLGICSHVTARTCLTAPNVATSDLEACLTPSMNQCVYPPGAESVAGVGIDDKSINPAEDVDIGLFSEAEAYENPKFQRFVTRCTWHVAET